MADPTAAAAHHDRDPGPSEDVAASAVRRLDFPPGLARLSGLPTLHELMHRHVSVRGASVAIRDPRGEITFGQLAAQGDAIAGALAGAGGRRGDPVLVLMHPGADVVASILGAAGAGRPAMLLDPLAPVDALRSVAPDLNNPVVLVDAAHVVHAEHLTAGDVIRVDALSETYTAAPSAGGLDEVAMVSWTSGSSGRPKGVMHTQRTVLSNGMRVSRSFSLSPSDRVLALAPLHFVGGSTPVFVALWAGASLDVCTMASQGPDAVARTIVDRGITALQMSPSHARALHEAAPTGGFPSLRLALVGGERLTVEQGRMLCATFPNARVVYRYSTSETFWVAGAELDRSKLEAAPAGVLPQGWTVPWLDVALVDRSPGDAGVETGELQVIGDALSVGYFDDAALTAERFPEHEGHRGFRTRDLFRRYPDGLLHHAGRLDRTLKVKGIRVDLDAVERALRALPPVDDAVVGAVPLRGGSRLVARVTVVGGGDAVTGASLRRDLTAVLPAAFVPSLIDVVPSMPVSSRGKVSLAVLEAGSEAMKEPPRTEVERVVVACAEAVLRIEPIGLHDDLIALGADSLDLMALAVRLEEALGIGFAPSVIIANPTPAALASVVNSGSVDLETLPRVVAGDAAQPLVLVSGGGGGEIEAMTSLARLIGDRDAYVAVPKGFESRAFPDRSVEAMARRIVGDVERLGLRHVTLIGHSSGGPVAFEAARQLTAMGNHPTGIVLLDTGWPRDRAERMRATRAAAAATGTPLHAAARNVRAVIRPRRWWWVASAGLVQRRGRERWDVFSVLRERALARYRPQPYVGAAVVFHASDPSESDKGAGSERWRSVITPRPDSRDVPGNHSSLVRPPYSTATAAALRDVLAAWRRVDHPDRVAGTH